MMTVIKATAVNTNVIKPSYSLQRSLSALQGLDRRDLALAR